MMHFLFFNVDFFFSVFELGGIFCIIIEAIRCRQGGNCCPFSANMSEAIP